MLVQALEGNKVEYNDENFFKDAEEEILGYNDNQIFGYFEEDENGGWTEEQNDLDVSNILYDEKEFTEDWLRANEAQDNNDIETLFELLQKYMSRIWENHN